MAERQDMYPATSRFYRSNSLVFQAFHVFPWLFFPSSILENTESANRNRSANTADGPVGIANKLRALRGPEPRSQHNKLTRHNLEHINVSRLCHGTTCFPSSTYIQKAPESAFMNTIISKIEHDTIIDNRDRTRLAHRIGSSSSARFLPATHRSSQAADLSALAKESMPQNTAPPSPWGGQPPGLSDWAPRPIPRLPPTFHKRTPDERPTTPAKRSADNVMTIKSRHPMMVPP